MKNWVHVEKNKNTTQTMRISRCLFTQCNSGAEFKNNQRLNQLETRLKKKSHIAVSFTAIICRIFGCRKAVSAKLTTIIWFQNKFDQLK